MALFVQAPELTIALPELPDPSQPNLVGVRPSQQLFRYGSDTYLVSITTKDPDGTGNFNAIVAKRVAGGPWTPLDQPANPVPHEDIWELQITGGQSQEQIGSTLHIIEVIGTNILAYITFDFISGAYTSLALPYYNSGTHVNSQIAYRPLIRALSDDRLLVVWGSPDATMTGAKFAFISHETGLMGAAATLVAPAGGQLIDIVGLVIDSTDAAHVLYNKSLGGNNLWHNTISSAGVIGTPDLVEGPLTHTYNFGPGKIFNGKVTFVGSQDTVAGISLWETSPTVISWTKKAVATRSGDVSSVIFPTAIATASNALFIAWPEDNPSVSPLTTQTVQFSVYDGTLFSAKAVAWDSGLNQYSGTGGVPAADTTVKYPSIAFDSMTGTLQLLAFADYTPAFDLAQLYLEVAFPAGAPVIVTTSVPNGSTGVPLSFQFAGHGTGPFIWSVPVGALPPGLTLDDTTGILSGTPTNPGTYPVQVQLAGSGGSSEFPPDVVPFTLVIDPPPDTAPGIPPGPGASGGGIPESVPPVVTTTTSGTPIAGSPWIPGNCWDISAPCARTGAYGLRRVAPCVSGDSATTSTQQISVTPGENYYLEFFVKTANGANGVLSFGFNFYDATGSFLSFLGIDSSGSPSDWTMYNGSIVAPLQAVTASPTIKSTGQTVGTFCVNSLYSTLKDERMALVSVKHYWDNFTSYR